MPTTLDRRDPALFVPVPGGRRTVDQQLAEREYVPSRPTVALVHFFRWIGLL